MFDRSIAADYSYHPDSPSLNIQTNEVTISAWIKLNKNLHEFENLYPTLIMKRPWNIG